MVTSTQCLQKYGNPELTKTQNKYFELWIGKRKEIIKSDKFILYLTEFLAY